LSAFEPGPSSPPAGLFLHSSSPALEEKPSSIGGFDNVANGGCLRGIVWAALFEGAILLLIGALLYMLTRAR